MPRRAPRLATLLATATLALVTTAEAAAQLPERGDRDAARVATGERLTFYSDFWFNLHDRLYWRTQRGGPVDAGATCLAGLGDRDRDAWSRAAAYYEAGMVERDPRTDDLMRSIRFDLTGLTPEGAEVPAERDQVYRLLEAAAPAYRACFWMEDDARNRDWIATVMALFEAHGAAAFERLDALYEEPWPRGIDIDVVGYSNWAGANTTGRPLHMLVSSTDGDITGPGGFEIVLHEGSHGVFGPGFGEITGALQAALEPHGLSARRDIWHAVLFYTAGRVARDRLRDHDAPDYEMYMVRVGVYDELYPLLAEHWQPYLDGAATLQQAADALAAAWAAATGQG